MLLSQAIEKFLNDLKRKNYADNTIKDYSKRLRIFRSWLEDKYNCQVYLSDITFNDVDDFLNWQQEKGNSGSSRNRDGYIISSFYKYLFKRDICDNVAKKVEPVKTRKKERVYLTEKEMEELIEAIDKPLIKIVTIFLYQTGCRINEALTLKLDDIDFINNVINIRQAKGNKDRNIALNQKLGEELKYYLEEERPNTDSDFVFATKRSGSLSRGYYTTRLKRSVKKTNINKNISAHSIRHSTAVALVKRGVDLPTIQKILGHENLQTTSIYVHSDMTRIRDALEAI